MEILDLNEIHKSQWLPLWNGYLEFYKENLPQEITDLTFARLCDPNEHNMGGFMAFDGDKAIGLVHYVIHRGTWSGKDVCYLEDLFVDPNVRGGGVGRALINKVADFAREEDHRHVYWMTQNDNSRARILYDNMAGQSEFVVYKLGIK